MSKWCPACAEYVDLKIHCSYFKYYYNNSIQILVVKCTNCGTYHAVIPSFSLPGTSLGTVEVENYIANLAIGKPRAEAGKQLLDNGISYKHLQQIEKMFHGSVERTKAIFVTTAPQEGSGLAWCRKLLTIQESTNIIYELNTFCLQHRVNAVFCNRFNILLFRELKAGSIASNNLGFVTSPAPGVDSS